MESCVKCKRCYDDMKTKNKCCDCFYMTVLEWEGWKRYCNIHDIFCDEVDNDGCDDFKQIKE